MKNDAVLGIDIGGSKVRMAPVFSGGVLGKRITFPVHPGVKPARLAALIGKESEKLKAEVRFTAAGAGCPGHVSNDRRSLLWAPNLGWKNIAFAELLENELSMPVLLENDVNSAAVGEHRCGAGVGARHVVCIFVGTGVGGGIISDGNLVRGATGNGAEVGHLLFKPGGKLCSCGRRGCVEAYAAGSQIPARYAEEGGASGLNASEIWQKARRGEDIAARVVDTAVEALASLIVNLQTLFDSEKIILGGGVLEHSKDLYGRLKKAAGSYFTGAWKSEMKIARSRLGADAGVLGAAALAQDLR